MRMNTFPRTAEFDAWLSGLKDKIGRARIVHRIKGDIKRAIQMAQPQDKE